MCCVHSVFVLCACYITFYYFSFNVLDQQIPVTWVERHGMLMNQFSILTGVAVGALDVER